MQAQDVMSTTVATIPVDASVRDAAKLMLSRRVSALPVTDGKGRLVGIVSEGDLMRRADLGTDTERSWWLRLLQEETVRDYVKVHGTSVADVMTSPAVSVRRTTPLKEVVRLLEKRRIKRVPVLEGGRLVGIVSRADLIRELATAPARPAPRTAGDRALRKQVLEQVSDSGVDASYVNVTVEHKTVYLWGSVRSNHEQKALRVAAKAVPGVRKVEDNTFVMPAQVAARLGAV
jgi:CBS domain-containing protein